MTDTRDLEPAAELLQEDPLANRLPAVAVPVVVAGVVATRETPPLVAIADSYTGLLGDVFHLVGAAPQRRRLLVSGTAAFAIGTDKGQVGNGFGFPVPANTVVTIQACEDIYVRLGAAGTVGFWAEVDPG